MKISYYLILITGIFLTSCVSLKKSIYLQGEIAKELSDVEATYDVEKGSYLVKPSDNLYIRINSLDERTSAFLNNESGATTRIESPMSASLAGYRVEDDGSIYFPFVGKVYVANLTLEQIRQKMQLAVSKYIEQSSVVVKLLNDNITVIGEVRGPGRFLLYDEQINILEALSMAGDMTDFANRKRVRLIRKEGDIQQMFVINTLEDKLINSPYFYVKPGDILYVEPRRLKAINLSTVPIGLVLTFLNTGILLYTFYNTTLTQD
nr:polysaccharide biosynthesis/export family protein [uncultured Carboxylicivirga sp.]